MNSSHLAMLALLIATAALGCSGSEGTTPECDASNDTNSCLPPPQGGYGGSTASDSGQDVAAEAATDAPAEAATTD